MLAPLTPKVIETGPLDEINVAGIPESDHAIIWDRAGERRLVPSPILRAAREIYDAGRTLRAHGIIDTIPDEWGRISWPQCRPLRRSTTVSVNGGGSQPRSLPDPIVA